MAMVRKPVIINNLQRHQSIREYSKQHFTNKNCRCINLEIQREPFICSSKLDCDVRLLVAFKRLHETLENHTCGASISRGAFAELDAIKEMAGCPKNLNSITKTLAAPDFRRHKLNVEKALNQQKKLIEREKEELIYDLQLKEFLKETYKR